ncbi:hypothetical protein CONLIGDRAFT_661544 [Coniochaeta ligniaria NRRL 30616]|uniref:Uncharacterized protein n=1 Tax=Coniochaeta ligniaria NRRL 30616 TaxID=1408157 RepID=A0A1J7IRR9_9PEZI|nr:hypothetical protein CONLIGDRAFT_661544 [Coniochaeta ligniaria NRRL 30616]
MASLTALLPTSRLLLPTLSRPMATASRHPSNLPSEASPSQPGKPLRLGELEGASFLIHPLKRSGEDVPTIRARLLYQSRKRGTLESDLLLSTFASQHLDSISRAQLEAPAAPGTGEWAQTVGTFKPAYRPVPKTILRTHVKEHGMGKGGMAFMPRLK